MFDFLKKTMGVTKSGSKNRRHAARQSVRLGLESLENREVLSGFAGAPVEAPNLSAQTALTTQAANLVQITNGINQAVTNAINNEIKVIEGWIAEINTLIFDLTHPVPSLQGVNFSMTSSQPGNNQTYTLKITSQSDQMFSNTATFQGVWGSNAAVTGTLTYEQDGSISIVANWTGGGGNNHTLTGTITGQPGSYHIDGNVLVNGSSSQGPGHVSGNQT
jgi:hypothetical protein